MDYKQYEDYEQEVMTTDDGWTIRAIYLTGKQNAIDRVMPFIEQKALEVMRKKGITDFDKVASE